mgnify:CR=1 FL=1
MNILNNLWLAISTPNEILVNICVSFLIIFIETPLSFMLITTTFNIQYTKKQKWLYISLVSIIGILSIFILSWPYNIVFNYATAFIILYFIMKIGFIKSSIATLFPSIIFNLLGTLLAKPYLAVLHITYDQTNTIIMYRIPFALLNYLIVFIINKVIKYKSVTIDILENFDKKNKLIITLNFIFGLFNIMFQGIITAYYTDILPIQITFLNFISLLMYFVLSFLSLAKISNLVTTTQKLESAEEYNKTLHILHDNVRGFKHDFDNIITTIGGYIRTNDMEGLKKYYTQLEEDCQSVNNLYILNPDVVNNDGIYNLITKKYHEAVSKNIKVNISFLLDLSTLNMKIYEFARILGILLDNAIEASSECDKKIINIIFRDDTKNSRQLVIIENTYKDKNIDTEKIFEKGISGKENHTGLGLWEVRKIVKKTTNVNLFTSKDEKFFKQQLEIYYKNSLTV